MTDMEGNPTNGSGNGATAPAAVPLSPENAQVIALTRKYFVLPATRKNASSVVCVNRKIWRRSSAGVGARSSTRVRNSRAARRASLAKSA